MRIEIIEPGHGSNDFRCLQNRNLRERAVELLLLIEFKLPGNDDGVACFVGEVIVSGSSPTSPVTVTPLSPIAAKRQAS